MRSYTATLLLQQQQQQQQRRVYSYLKTSLAKQSLSLSGSDLRRWPLRANRIDTLIPGIDHVSSSQTLFSFFLMASYADMQLFSKSLFFQFIFLPVCGSMVESGNYRRAHTKQLPPTRHVCCMYRERERSVDHLRGWRALDVFFFTCDSQLPKKKSLEKNGWPLPFAALFSIFSFYSFLLGNLRRNKQPTKRIIIIKKRKKRLGLGFYSDPSIDLAVCFFAQLLCCAVCVSLWAGELLVVG